MIGIYPNPSILLQKLQRKTRVSPPSHSVALAITGSVCGWATPGTAAVLLEKGLARPQPGGLQIDDPDTLGAVALALRDTGQLKGWRDEALDVLAADDRVLGRIERAAMRPLGLRTRAVHLQALGAGGRIWIARRSIHKSTDPGLWDTLVGGLVGAGESLDEALLRESNEEAGLLPEELQNARRLGQFEVSREVPEGYQVESTWISVCRLPDERQPVNRDGEVDRIELAGVQDVLRAIADDRFTAEAALSILHWLLAAHGPEPSLQRDASGLA
ncbi:MAG: NUDIX domain-containing protein [Pigmentiphaga sp.]